MRTPMRWCGKIRRLAGAAGFSRLRCRPVRGRFHLLVVDGGILARGQSIRDQRPAQSNLETCINDCFWSDTR